MTTREILNGIREAVDQAPKGEKTAVRHIQIIKHAEALSGVTEREFCETLGWRKSWGSEFSKMKKIASRLQAAGLDVDRL